MILLSLDKLDKEQKKPGFLTSLCEKALQKRLDVCQNQRPDSEKPGFLAFV